jgi:DNA transformation protein
VGVTNGYLQYVLDQLDWVRELRPQRMFGGVGLYSGELFFAILVDQTLYLKADDANRASFRRGGGEAFSYLRRGKPLTMDYWSVPADILEEPDRLRSWAGTALDAALRARKGRDI